MAKRGDVARQSVMDTIIQAFAADGNFVTVADKKVYVTAKDGVGGETIQFSIAITMPKTPVAASAATPAANNDWSSNNAPMTSVAANTMPTELSAADRAKVEELKARLGVK